MTLVDQAAFCETCGNMPRTHDGGVLGHPFTPPSIDRAEQILTDAYARQPPHESLSEVSERQKRTLSSDTSDGYDRDHEEDIGDLLGGLRDGDWLDNQDFPALRYAVDGLLPEGFSLLIGPPKAGKSWLALGMLLAVAGGTRAVGAIPTGNQRRVLYLALEDGDRRMQDRCRKILENRSIPGLFHYMTQIRPGTIVATIRTFLARYPDTALVVIDTLGKVLPPAMNGESAYQRDYRVAGALKLIADEHPGLAVSALHHDRKAASEDFVDSVSGTHGLAGAADTIVVLARKRQATDAILSVTGRDVPEAEYGLTMTGGGLWALDGQSLTEAAENARRRSESSGLGDVSLDVLEFVRKHPDGVQAKTVADAFGTDVYQYLGRLEKAGRLSRPKRGWYKSTPDGIPGFTALGAA